MLKKFFAISIFILGATSLMAQENPAQSAAKVTTQDAMSYNRNSITVIPITGMTNYDAYVINWAKGQDFGGKFDYNDITVPPINKITGLDEIQQELLKNSIPKKVVDYWLQYDGNKFSASVLESRALYNATDADVIKDKASRVSSIKENGKPLMKNSFLLVAGPTVVEEKVDKKGKKSYNAKSSGYVYHVDINDEVLETIYQNWLDDEATTENKQAYDGLVIGLESSAFVTGASGTASSPNEAIEKSLGNLFEKLEKKIDKWQVVTSVYQLHPIGAKIGTKEGLKNSDRYTIFRLVESEDNELTYKRVGYVRATKVANNSQVADGNSPCSNFYQISGRRNAKEGMFLKQNKDTHLSVSLSGNFLNSPNYGNVDVDYLIHTTQTLGIMQYAGLSIGGFYGNDETGEKAIYLPISLHYGIGIHPLRWIEIMPNIGIGGDVYIRNDDLGTDDDESFAKKLAYYIHGGVKFGFQVWYPVQIFVRADYSCKIAEGEWYVNSEKNRFGFSLGAGVRVNF